MTPQQLVGLACRLFAVWLVLNSIAFFTAIPAALASAPLGAGESAGVSYAIGAAYVVIALLLWFFPMLAAQKLLPRTQFENRLSVPGFELARVGVALMGLWLFAKAMPHLVWFVFRALLVADAGSSFNAVTTGTRLEIIVSVVELAFAVLVIVKAGAFASWLLPSPGTRPAAASDDA